MVGKLRAAINAKMERDPNCVMVARCDYDGVPGATFEEVMERCLAYKRATQVDVVCPAVQSGEENQKAIRRIPGPVLPLLTHNRATHPTLQELQAAAAWYPALTTMVGLQTNWDFLHDFPARGTAAIDAFLEQASASKWGAVSNGSVLGAERIREMEDTSLPSEVDRDIAIMDEAITDVAGQELRKRQSGRRTYSKAIEFGGGMR